MPVRARGFTLLEMVIVIAIISVLVLLAIFTYRQMADRARAVEASMNLGSLYTAEVVFKLENDTYRACDVHPRPDDRLDRGKVPWTDEEPGFREIGFSPEGGVVFNYRVEPVTAISLGFEATAKCDFNDDGRLGAYTIRSDRKQVVKVADD